MGYQSIFYIFGSFLLGLVFGFFLQINIGSMRQEKISPEYLLAQQAKIDNVLTTELSKCWGKN